MVRKITTVFKVHKPPFRPQLNDSLYRQVTSDNTLNDINDYVLNELDTLRTFPQLYIAAVGTAWPQLGSPRNGQATLHLLQKHLLCRAYIYSQLQSLWTFFRQTQASWRYLCSACPLSSLPLQPRAVN